MLWKWQSRQRFNQHCDGLDQTVAIRPRLCKNVFQRHRYSKPDWKSRFYAKSTSADVPINFRFNVDAHTSILAKRFYTLWAKSGRRKSLEILRTNSQTTQQSRNIFAGGSLPLIRCIPSFLECLSVTN
ncbi:hypothetical protein QF045_004102 [Pseudomonas sp. W4I3]|jgi:hypothetical protein|nr:hypothetical protein [Pseudomonas sp. W4I3]